MEIYNFYHIYRKNGWMLNFSMFLFHSQQIVNVNKISISLLISPNAENEMKHKGMFINDVPY